MGKKESMNHKVEIPKITCQASEEEAEEEEKSPEEEEEMWPDDTRITPDERS